MLRALDALVLDALAEDAGPGDVTTNAAIPADTRCRARLIAKQDGVLSGIRVVQRVFETLDPGLAEWQALSDTARFQQGDQIASFQGNARAMLTGERTALNFVQRLSGIATHTAAFVKAVEGLDVRICDTRKTTPLLRQLEKQAVIHGGGMNHRYALFDGIVIKENHITAAGGITRAIQQVVKGAHHLLKIEVEVTNLEEYEEALGAGTDAILLDNMSIEEMREAVNRLDSRRVGGLGILPKNLGQDAQATLARRVILEASGNITLDNVRSVAETGVHVLSIGALTHSAPAVDMSLLISNV